MKQKLSKIILLPLIFTFLLGVSFGCSGGSSSSSSSSTSNTVSGSAK